MEINTSRVFDRTGSIVRVRALPNKTHQYQYGVTVKSASDVFILFKDGTFLKRDQQSAYEVEYVCATYLVGEDVASIDHMMKLFKKGRYDDAFRGMS